METVYVLSEPGEPLMPTARCGHVRWLLKNGLAKVEEVRPFTIRLLYGTEEGKQRIILGIDEGRTNIGMCAVREDGTPLMALHCETRNKEIPKLMQERKANRRHHRRDGRRKARQRRAKANGTAMPLFRATGMGMRPAMAYNHVTHALEFGTGRIARGAEEPVIDKIIRGKEARFNNRLRPERWLTPTANQLLETHVSLIKKMAKYLPVTDVVLEVNRFAFMELDDPNVRKWQYQRGPLYNTGGLHAAVSAQQGGRCLLCGKAAIENYHHMVPRSKRGSDTIGNIAGLCAACHAKAHTNPEAAAELESKKSGMNKRYSALSVLNQINPKLLEVIGEMLPGHAYMTGGRSTWQFRGAHGVAKDHASDAYCIAMSILPEGTPAMAPEADDAYELRQYRRHDRRACKQEMADRKYLKDGKAMAVNRHRAHGQEAPSLEEYVKNGGQTCDLTVKEHHKTYQRMGRVMPGATVLVDGRRKTFDHSKGLHNGRPDYYYFTDGTKATPRHCRVMKHNTGIVFV